jgi:glycosidase
MKKFLVVISFLFLQTFLFAQETSIYPGAWWVGMKNQNVQLMIHGENVAAQAAKLAISYPGVSLVKVNKVDNPNYLFVDLKISPAAKPGTIKIPVSEQGKLVVKNFELTARRVGKGKGYAQGVTSSDFIYFLMPDRFSNGDPSNDRVIGMKDQTLNRDSIYHRHGGDLQGIIDHLDYIQGLGATALWVTPVYVNDMPNRTEHGYAFTDHYKIEPRFGGETAYKKLSDELHKRGMKLIQDAVYNHVGRQHFTVQDKPMKDWLHEWPSYKQTNYKDQVLMDPYASKEEQKVMSDGWFTTQMPDLNQSNPYVANYLIQNAIWAVEEFGVDGWRIDTYIYNDMDFMNRCNKALLDEYPAISLFGETWVHGTANQAYFVENNLDIPFKSNLPGATDFQTLMYGIEPALTQNFGWTEGVNKLYQTLANDFLYKDAMKNVVFLDNHDMTRFLSKVNEDVDKLKIGIMWLLTTRGIPQLYYGTENLMKGVSNPDGWVRLDFQGGWAGDKQNKFTKEGRTTEENEVNELTRKLGNFRKGSSAIKTGKMMQYIPQDGLYVYFRYDNNQTVMCVMNTSDKSSKVDFGQYSERTKGFASAKSVTDDKSFKLNEAASIPAKTMWVLELGK